MHPSRARLRLAYALPRPRTESQPEARPGLTIRCATGAGTAPTRLAAFDAALREIGVANYNLISLSSVIPAGSVVVRARTPLPPPGAWGDRLYVVTADARTDVPGTDVWAAVGWVSDPQSGRGLLVEHQGHSEAEVTADVEASLTSLRRGRGRAGDCLTDRQVLTRGITCIGDPACALVMAVFGAESWRSDGDTRLPDDIDLSLREGAGSSDRPRRPMP